MWWNSSYTSQHIEAIFALLPVASLGPQEKSFASQGLHDPSCHGRWKCNLLFLESFNMKHNLGIIFIYGRSYKAHCVLKSKDLPARCSSFSSDMEDWQVRLTSFPLGVSPFIVMYFAF
jgi:hypothetical protein